MYKNYFKRFLDVLIATSAFILLSPITITISLILLYANKGTPFFTQPRPGKNEKIFHILKFKTMNDGIGINGELLQDSERITRVGDFLRKTSLDEIPQLINVIKGDMGLVGPRPLRVRYLPYYTKKESVRHSIRPGITGLAQVSGRNSINWDEKLKKDVEYIERISFLLDFKILLKTVHKIFNSSNINLNPENDSLDEYRSRIKKMDLS